ncbi:hypothetical protein BGLA2_470017 [Burkholderia gladioli]|nr:hypothetical protein BGLA2_470017 [Burkholderia gladioli]
MLPIPLLSDCPGGLRQAVSGGLRRRFKSLLAAWSLNYEKLIGTIPAHLYQSKTTESQRFKTPRPVIKR